MASLDLVSATFPISAVSVILLFRHFCFHLDIISKKSKEFESFKDIKDFVNDVKHDAQTPNTISGINKKNSPKSGIRIDVWL